LLIHTVKSLYEKRVQNVRFLLPIIIGLTKEEVISFLPKLVMLKPNVLKPGNSERLRSNTKLTHDNTSHIKIAHDATVSSDAARIAGAASLSGIQR